MENRLIRLEDRLEGIKQRIAAVERNDVRLGHLVALACAFIHVRYFAGEPEEVLDDVAPYAERMLRQLETINDKGKP